MNLSANTKSNNINHILKTIDSINTSFCIFLDIDGTISEFNVDPKKSFIPLDALNIIQKFQTLDIPIFAVTGRSALTAYALFHPIELPIAGSHGLEIFENPKKILNSYSNFEEINALKKAVHIACYDFPELLIENKTHSVALHYRASPELKIKALKIMSELQLSFPFTYLLSGKCVYELLPHEANKGFAIAKFIQHYQLENFCPIFIGDDVTDEAGFETVNTLDGISIKVGNGDSHAQFRLDNVNEVILFLAHLYQAISLKQRTQNLTMNKTMEKHYV